MGIFNNKSYGKYVKYNKQIVKLNSNMVFNEYSRLINDKKDEIESLKDDIADETISLKFCDYSYVDQNGILTVDIKLKNITLYDKDNYHENYYGLSVIKQISDKIYNNIKKIYELEKVLDDIESDRALYHHYAWHILNNFKLDKELMKQIK